MIVNFSVKNFRSFNEEQTLNLVASNRIADHPTHLVPIPGSTETALRGCVFFGANGAGKSNLFKALSYLQNTALRSSKRKTGTNRQPFQFSSGNQAPSEFDLTFVSEGTTFRYGLVVDDHAILEEWLVILENGSESIVFESVASQPAIHSAGLQSSGEEVVKLAGISRRRNQTFLSAIRTTLDESKVMGPIRSVIRWFRNDLVLIGPDAFFKRLSAKILTDPAFKDFASDFLRSASTGVDALHISKQNLSELEVKRLLGEEEAEQFLNSSNPLAASVFRTKDGTELLRDETGCYIVSIQANHNTDADGTDGLLDLAEESDGTQRLLHLLPALHDLRQRSVVYVIDEIDRSLHPHLTKAFLHFFFSHCGDGHNQIISTTHDTNLLDGELFRRDEVWFVSKHRDLSSELFSLLEFKPRNDLKIDKAYLQGRFGAVPHLGGIEFLLPEEPELQPA